MKHQKFTSSLGKVQQLDQSTNQNNFQKDFSHKLKVFIFILLTSSWNVGQAQSIFQPLGGGVPGLPGLGNAPSPVGINTAPALGVDLHVDGQVRFQNLFSVTLLDNFLAIDPVGNIYNQTGSLPLLGTFGQTLYWSNTNWQPTSFLYVDPTTNFVGVNATSPLSSPFAYNVTNPGTAGAWVGGGGIATNTYFSVQGGDIETDGNYYGNNIYLLSDARLKKDITELSDWKKMLELKSYSYRFINQKGDQLSYGFIAQDVLQFFPELTSTWRGGGSVNYIGFIPFLAQGLKEHEKRLTAVEMSNEKIEVLKVENQILSGKVETLESKNNQLEKRLALLEQKLNAVCNLPCIQNNQAPKPNEGGTGSGIRQTGTLKEQPVLAQNEPNPFTQETVIRYFLPEGSVNSKIEVKNAEGKIVGSFLVSQTGHGTITISSGMLAAGSYFYSLVINNNVIDTKKMVLIN